MGWRIKTVVERTGVRPETLRSWERRYDLVRPDRGASGYRQYSDADIAVISRVKGLIDSGLAVSEAIARAREEGALEPPRVQNPEARPGPPALREPRQLLLGALLDVDPTGAQAALNNLPPLPWRRMLMELLMPVHRELAWLVQQGSASPAQAGFASSWLGARLATMRFALEPGPTGGPLAIAVGLPPAPDPVPLEALTLGLLFQGWRTLSLGASVPLDHLGPVLARKAPSLLAVQLPAGIEAPDLRPLFDRLRTLSPAGCRLVVAGLPAGERPPEGVLHAPSPGDLPPIA